MWWLNPGSSVSTLWGILTPSGHMTAREFTERQGDLSVNSSGPFLTISHDPAHRPSLAPSQLCVCTHPHCCLPWHTRAAPAVWVWRWGIRVPCTALPSHLTSAAVCSLPDVLNFQIRFLMYRKIVFSRRGQGHTWPHSSENGRGKPCTAVSDTGSISEGLGPVVATAPRGRQGMSAVTTVPFLTKNCIVEGNLKIATFSVF